MCQIFWMGWEHLGTAHGLHIPHRSPCAAGQGSARMTRDEREDFLVVQQSLNKTATVQGLEQMRSISTKRGHFGDLGRVKHVHSLILGVACVINWGLTHCWAWMARQSLSLCEWEIAETELGAGSLGNYGLGMSQVSILGLFIGWNCLQSSWTPF